MLRPSRAAAVELRQGGLDGGRVARLAPGGEARDLVGLDGGVDRQRAALAGRERRGLGLDVSVDADDDRLARFDAGEPRGVRGDQLGLHVVDGGDRAAHLVDLRQLGARGLLQRLDLGLDHRRAVEEVAVFQQVRLVGQHLLQPQRPLLVPGPRQAQRLVPGGQLHGAGAGVLRQRDGQRLQQDAVDVVLGLLLGQPERVDLHAIAEAAQLGVLDAVAARADLVPEVDEGAHLAHLGDEPDAGVDEEADAADDLREILGGHAWGAPRRARRRPWRARRPAPARASRRPPADGRSRRSSGSTSATSR